MLAGVSAPPVAMPRPLSVPRLAACLAVALPAFAALAQAPSPAPVTAPAPDFGGGVLQLFVGLILVLGLLVGALWLLKQVTQRRGPNSPLLRVVAGTAVGPRERVVVVEIGSTWLVLGVAPGRVNALAEVPRGSAPDVADRRPATTGVSNPAPPAAPPAAG